MGSKRYLCMEPLQIMKIEYQIIAFGPAQMREKEFALPWSGWIAADGTSVALYDYKIKDRKLQVIAIRHWLPSLKSNLNAWLEYRPGVCADYQYQLTGLLQNADSNPDFQAAIHGETGKRASNSGKLNQLHKWRNPDSGNSGSITLFRRFQMGKSECVEVRITIDSPGESVIDEFESFCRNDNGKWIAAPVSVGNK